MIKTSILLILIALISITVTSCKKDEKREPVCEDGSTPTYDGEMKTFVDSNCTSSGCHGSGSGNGDYTTYSGMSGDLTSGRISSRVLNQQDMPKNAELSQAELNLFQCWADNGFLEN